MLNVGYFKEKKYFMSYLFCLNFLKGNKMSTAYNSMLNWNSRYM